VLSATSYSLVGVLNKFLTILLNVFLFEKHSSPFGLFSVCICLLAGIFYQQAPLRPTVSHSQSLAEGSDSEEAEPLNLSTKESVQFLAKV
jgi:hypothetical protein